MRSTPLITLQSTNEKASRSSVRNFSQSQGFNPRQSLRFNLPPTLLDSRPCITYRENYDFNEALPQQYTDILSSRDDKLRLSCPREIKGDPIDIDNSIIMITPKKPKIPLPNRQKRSRRIIQ